MDLDHRHLLLSLVLVAACGASDPASDPDAPVIASFATNVQPLYENGMVMFSATVTDPQGPTDIVSGRLAAGATTSYGTFVAQSAGTYTLALDWATIQAAQSINGDASGEDREFRAEFVDAEGHMSSDMLTLTLACKTTQTKEAPCDGVCTGIEIDRFNCGGCNLACPNAPSDPLSPLSFCRDSLCQEVRLMFSERISCDAACASKGGKCDHDGVCPGNQCDLDEQSYATYSGGISAPLAGCSAVPAATNTGQPFVSLGCNCKDVPAS
jgi:hypothetical protein